jgi:SAM-dependent methyltransferase
MGSMLRFNLRHLRKLFNLQRLVETGTGRGDSLAWAVRSGFSELHSVELAETLYQSSLKRFADFPQVHLQQGASASFLAKVGAGGTALPALYFLDAHFLGGADFGLTTYAESARDPGSYPLLDELDALLTHDLTGSVIIMDDVRMYFDGDFQTGICPEFARRWEERPALLELVERLRETHESYLLRDDDGYLVLAPKGVQIDRATWLNIRPQDSSGELRHQPGVPGVTAISIQRRLQDSRFATRYFRGNGLDVGGGIDSIAVYREFFPLMKNVFVYDRPHGDAQLLANVVDESFDFLYSSHCLEHLRDPAEALENWLRVMRPGGHLIINVPDEDLYEQGQWPSRFNSDHKLTFTIAKPASWSPVSINLLDLLGPLRGKVEIVSLQLLDQGYRYASMPRGVDQTRAPMAECSIEFILRKRPQAAATASSLANQTGKVAQSIPDHQYYRPLFSPWLGYGGFDAVMAAIAPHTLVSCDRVWILHSLAKQALNLPGDYWECGVFKGGTAIMLAQIVAPSGKQLHLFDTFNGMPDTDPSLDLHRKGDFSDNDLDAVRQRFGSAPHVEFHPGYIPQTFEGLESAHIAFAHIDVDIHQSVMDCCKFIYPRLADGGCMVFDDYGFPTCPGARAAVDAFFADKPERPLVLPTGQAIVTKIPVRK